MVSKKSSRKTDSELSREPVHRVTDGEEVGELEEVREQMAVIQHQINNRLAVILGNVQFLLLKSDQLDDKLIKRFKVVEKAALKISEVNQQLTGLTEPHSINLTDSEKGRADESEI